MYEHFTDILMKTHIQSHKLTHKIIQVLLQPSYAVILFTNIDSINMYKLILLGLHPQKKKRTVITCQFMSTDPPLHPRPSGLQELVGG